MKRVLEVMGLGILGGVFVLSSVLLDTLALMFAGFALCGFLSGKLGFTERIASIISIFILSTLFLLAHTAVYGSNAVMGLLALILYSVFTVPVFFLFSFAGRRVLK